MQVEHLRPQIKYIAVYQVAPQSAITYVAPVSSIEPWGDTKKFVVNFAEPARKIGPIPLLKNGLVKAPQNLRYTNYERLLQEELFPLEPNCYLIIVCYV